MKILISPNAYKGSLGSLEAAEVIASALEEASEKFICEQAPIADGGDDSLRTITQSFQGTYHSLEVHNPLGQPITATYSTIKHDETAIVELTHASGLKLISASERSPMNASTFGTGELIKQAIGKGAKEVLLAVGGSATIDGGTGILNALGVDFYDEQGELLFPCGKNLHKIADYSTNNVPTEIKETPIRVLCDVNSPLLGRKGAVHVYGPQKGAKADEIAILEDGLKNLAEVMLNKEGLDVRKLDHAGASGGVPAGLHGILKAEIHDGFPYIANLIRLKEKIEVADVIITGEGSLDYQTPLGNKAPYQLAKLANGKPVVGIFGQTPESFEGFEIFTASFSMCNKPMDLSASMLGARQLIYNTAHQIGKLLEISCNVKEQK